MAPVTLPAVRLAVPEAPTVRLPIWPVEFSVPPVTLARLVNVPDDRVVLPPVTSRAVKTPPVPLSSPAEVALVMVQAEIFAVAAAPTVRLPRLIAECSVPPVTLALPLKVPAERFEVPPLT